MNIEAARAALAAYTYAHRDSDDIVDLMTDLCHLYAEDDSDPLPLLDMVRQHWEEERERNNVDDYLASLTPAPAAPKNPLNGFWFCPSCWNEWTDTQEARSVCPKCGLFVHADDEEREDPLQEVKDFMARDEAKAAVPPLTQLYTVLLLYPDYIATDGPETYLAHVEAANIDDALTEAQLEAHEANDYAGDRHDFAPLFICEGHHTNLVGVLS